MIIAAWQAEQTLSRAVESVRAAFGGEAEVIIVDDASRDGTLRVARDLERAHPGIGVIGLPENRGPAAARNAALDSARGRWIAVLDADDAFLPGRLDRLTRFATERQADIVADGLLLVDHRGQSRPAEHLSFSGDPTQGPWSLTDYVRGNLHGAAGMSLGYLKPVFRREFLEQHDLRYDETLRNGEDFHFVLSALARGGRMHYLATPGYRYSVGNGSISHRLDPEHGERLAAADLAFAEREAEAVGDAVVSMMRARARDVADLAAAETAMRAIRGYMPAAAVIALARRPRAWRRFARQMHEAVRKRAGRS